MSSATAPVTMRSTRTSGASFAIFCGSGFGLFDGLDVEGHAARFGFVGDGRGRGFDGDGEAKLLGNARGLGCFADAPFGHGKAEVLQKNLGIMFAQHDFAFACYGRCGQCRQRFVAAPSCGR